MWSGVAHALRAQSGAHRRSVRLLSLHWCRGGQGEHLVRLLVRGVNAHAQGRIWCCVRLARAAVEQLWLNGCAQSDGFAQQSAATHCTLAVTFPKPLGPLKLPHALRCAVRVFVGLRCNASGSA